jgi:hypothetical protein
VKWVAVRLNLKALHDYISENKAVRHLFQIIALASLVCYSPTVALAQNSSPDSSEVMRQLLALPAPTPRSGERETATDPEPKKPRPPKFFDKDKAPPDDAPIEDLLEYWSRWADTSGRPDPSDVVKQKLLDACVDDLERLPRFLALFSLSETTAAQIRKLYDKGQSDQQLDESWRDKVKKWLVFSSKYFLGDLLTLANKVKDDAKGGYVDKEEALVALARVDWSAAEPLVQSLASGSQPRSAALAIILLYKQAISSKDVDAEEKYRTRLKIISADRNSPAHARDAAIEVLSITDWSGRDDWYISLLADDSLRECTDGIYLFHPLTTLFDRDPEKWIPVMTKLVDSNDRAVQQAAASCLVIYATDHPRRDAILPVLHWLSDPDWLHINGTQRAWFMQKMDDLEMPESVPGLIWIVEHEEFNRQWAARTLAHYKDARAVPALKKALTESNEGERQFILEGLLASGGVSEAEEVNALEAYAAKLTTPEGREEMGRYRSYGDDPLPTPLSIGRYLATRKDVPETLVRAVLDRAASLQKSNAPVAQSLLEVAHQWQSRQADLDMVHRIANGTADAKTIANALSRRTKLHESLATELQILLASNGPAQGIGSVLLEDGGLAQSVLGSGNQSSQIALLACARLTQTALPVEQVGALMQSKNALLALAAERYLIAEDSKEARQLLWQRHPNEAFVTGWRENIELIGGSNFDLMGKMEATLRAELFKDNPPLEIFALVANDEQYSRVLRVYSDKAIYTHYEDSARYRERVISKQELSVFKQFVTANGLSELGPQFGPCHHDCWSSEFLALTKEKGRRVFSHQGFGGWITVLGNFDLLGRGDGAKIHYNLEKEIKGLEVLYADDGLVVKDVWQQGAEIRIFVEREETEDEIKERNKSEDSVDEDDEAARAEQRRRESARLKARFSWRTLSGGKAGEVTSQPEGYSRFDENKFLSDDDDESSRRDDRQVQMITSDSVIIARNFDGLWKQVAGRKAVRISGDEGAYATPIVTPDGKWVVVAKTDSDWSKPNYVVRFNLQTGRELRVNLPPADQFDPIAYLALHGKVLLRRTKDDYGRASSKSVGPDHPEYYLLDAATGETRLVSGEFAPLRQEGKRFLQPTHESEGFWAAIPNRERNQTEVGRYNLKSFSFEPLLLIPHITFDSTAMWVDEAGAKLYVVYEGNLLRLPVPNTH